MRFILMTTPGSPIDASVAEAVGIVERISKPFSPPELLACVQRALAGPVAAPVAGARGGAAPAAASLSILLAEDNPVNQRVAQRMLEKLGHSVVVASNGREAVDALETARFDAVLMDMQMPEMDGLQATGAIRTREMLQGLARVPVIALTANAMKGDREKCLMAGMDAYLSKPIKSAELKDALDSYARPSAVARRVVGFLHVRPEPSPVCYVAGRPTVRRRGRRRVVFARFVVVLAEAPWYLHCRLPGQPACGG